MSESKYYYLRTDLGEFKVKAASSEALEDLIKNDPGRAENVETLTGFKCKIKLGDVKIYGLLDDYMQVFEEEKEGGALLAAIADLKFFFSRDRGDVSIVFLDDKGDEIGRKRYVQEEFVAKFLNELPNKVLDAIIKEDERRAFD